MKLKSILLASAIALTCTWSATILSFSEVDRSFSQLVDLADVILIGTVTDSSTEWGEGKQASSIFTVVTLDDLDLIKGSVSGARYEFRHVGGRMGDLVQYYEGMPRLKVGTRYLLFIPGDTDVLFPTVGVSQGIFVVVRHDGGSNETIQTVGQVDVLGIRDDRVLTHGTGVPLTVDQFASCIEDQMLGISHGIC